MGQGGQREPGELADTALADGEARLELPRQLRVQLDAFHAGVRRPGVTREDLLAGHKALQAELGALHLQDLAGDIDAAAHERFRERVRRLTDQLAAIRPEARG